MIDFLDQTRQTSIKVCGIRSASQLEATIAVGVDAIGINFWPRSKRFLNPDEAQDWLPEFRYEATVVGLFVDADLDEIIACFDNELFGVAQLHGNESSEFCQQLADREIPYIKALGVEASSNLGDLDVYGTDYLLLDAAQQGFGGGGVAFDWNIAAEIIVLHPDKRFLLAGGIHPGNVAEAIRIARPAAVDVASGVELAAGVKDIGLIKELVCRVREADAKPS